MKKLLSISMLCVATVAMRAQNSAIDIIVARLNKL